MIHTGIDWSGDPGDPPGSPRYLCMAAVHADATEAARIGVAIDRLKLGWSWPADKRLKHLGASGRTHADVFRVLGSLDWSANVLLVDKARRPPWFVSAARGDARIAQAVGRLIACCPDSLVANQVAQVDLPRSELTLVRDHRRAIKTELRATGKTSFRTYDPRAKGTLAWVLIDIADFIAGEVAEQIGLAGPYLPALASRITIW